MPLNDRTLGYILRFYLFVFYFGASIPSTGWPFNKEWYESKTGITDDSLLSDCMGTNTREKQSLNGVYLPGGAPQAAAIALKEFVSIMLARLGTGTEQAQSKHKSNSLLEEPSCPKTYARLILKNLIENAMNRVDVQNYTQLALYQIHRSGGSELFWHDMINSCGAGLFGKDTLSSQGVNHANIISFSILASFVKISSGKVRTIFYNAEPVPRDVASKLLSLELILHFIKMWHVAVTAEDLINCTEENKAVEPMTTHVNDEMESVATMVYVIRRLVVPTLLSNTSASLEDCRVFRRIIRIISYLWCNSYYRRRMKIDLAVLIEHFVLKLLCLGPQVQRSLGSACAEESGASSSDMPLLLHQQLDVLAETKIWFSSNPKEVLDLFLNYDIDFYNQGWHKANVLPPAYCKLTYKICEALCTLAEKCGTIINQHGRFTSISGVNGSPRKSVVSPREDDLSDMAHAREAALLMREKTFAVITVVVKSMMDCAALSRGSFQQLSLSMSKSPSLDENTSFEMSPQLSPSPDFGDENILDYWHTSIGRRKAPLQPTCQPFSINEGNQGSSFESETAVSLRIKQSMSDDSSKYAQHKQEALDVAFELISSKGLKKGLDYLIACHLLTPSPRDVASFLRIHQSSIDPETLGDYLGEGGIDGADKDYWNLIRFNYARAVSFVGMNVEQA